MRITNLALGRQSPICRLSPAMLLIAMCLLPIGCGRKGPTAKVVHGNVVCGNEKVAAGRLFFVPIEGTARTNCYANISDGQYRIEAGGGVPLGKYRVCLDARKKTGRKVTGFNGLERTMTDETIRLEPKIYTSDQSPLVVDITADFNGQFDIAIPQ